MACQEPRKQRISARPCYYMYLRVPDDCKGLEWTGPKRVLYLYEGWPGSKATKRNCERYGLVDQSLAFKDCATWLILFLFTLYSPTTNLWNNQMLSYALLLGAIVEGINAQCWSGWDEPQPQRKHHANTAVQLADSLLFCACQYVSRKWGNTHMFHFVFAIG